MQKRVKFVVAAIVVVAVVVAMRPPTVEEIARGWVKDNGDLVAVKMTSYILPEIGIAGRSALEHELDALIAESMVWRYGQPQAIQGDLHEVTATASAQLDNVLPIVGGPSRRA